MGKRNKMVVGFIVVIIIVVFIIYGFLSLKQFLYTTGLDFESVENSTPIKFEEKGQTIFLTTRIFGLGGQHFQTIISNIDHASNNILIDKEKEIVLDGICEFYYKVLKPDSLLIFFSSGSYSEEEIMYRQLDGVKVKITKYKATMDRHYRSHQELGLLKVNCYDGTE